MLSPLRKLNEEGIRRFAEYLRAEAHGPAPVGLLAGNETSDPISRELFPQDRVFTNRYEFGRYLVELLDPLGPAMISRDRGLWSGLALLWFDQLCPPDSAGNRHPKEHYRYILSDSYRHYYRHLVRTPWQLVLDHGDNARFLLISPKPQKHPLSVGGEILEQLAGRQSILRSRPIIAAANRLYLDPKTNRPRKGVAGRGRGCASRFGLVLRQLELTYDPEVMSEEAFLAILPREFDRWKSVES